MVGILDRPQNQNYSSRAGGAAYCVADESIDAFRRFHAALYAQQPGESGGVFPGQCTAGRGRPSVRRRRDVPECINKGTYVDMVSGLAEATEHHRPPRPSASTVRTTSTALPDALVAKIKEIVGDVPALDAAAPAPAPRTGVMTVTAPNPVARRSVG